MTLKKEMKCWLISLTAEDLLSQYGWYLLAVTVLVYLLIQHLSKRRSRVPCSPPTQTPQGQHQHDQYLLMLYKGQISQTQFHILEVHFKDSVGLAITEKNNTTMF